MIRRLLILLVGLVLASIWSRRILAAMRGGRPAASGQATRREIKDGGPMVRDRVCNTFLPKSSALSLTVGSEEHYFCSETCRREFESQHRAHTA